jgi:hypothetical protein
MRRTRIVFIVLGFLAALPAMPQPGAANAWTHGSSNWQQRAAARTGGALATLAVGSERFHLWTTNPGTVAQLQALRAGSSSATIPNGRIRRGSGLGAHNAPWHWHLDARDVQMADSTTEVCDGSPSYVETHLRAFVGTVKRYCPWSARLVALTIYRPAGPRAMPTDLRIISVEQDATSAQNTTVSLSWRDNSTAESGFQIVATLTRRFGSPGSHTWSVPANTHTTTLHVVAGGINPLDRICFTVAGIDGASNLSNPSAPACVTL